MQKLTKTIRTALLIIGILVIIIALVIGVCLLLENVGKNPVKAIEETSGIKLPTDMEVLHNYQPTGFIQGGRNPQYTVFQLKERPTAFLSENEFVTAISPDEIPTIRLYGYKQFKVPEEYYPPWDKEFMWARIHPVNFIYFEEAKWLVIILESN